MSSAKWRPFCLGLNVLIMNWMYMSVFDCIGDEDIKTIATPLQEISGLLGTLFSNRYIDIDMKRCKIH